MESEEKSDFSIEQSQYWIYFRPITILSNIAGCYCYPQRKGTAYSLRFYSILISVLLLYVLYRGSAPLFEEPAGLDTKTLFKCFFVVYFLLCLSCQLFTSFSSPVIRKVLEEIDCGNKSSRKARLLLKKLAIFTFQSVIFKITSTYVMMALCVFDVIKIAYNPIVIPGAPKPLLLIPGFFAQTALSVSMGLFTVLCSVIIENFRSLTNEIENASTETLLLLQQRHQRLVNATRAMDKYFSKYIFAFYALTLPLVCFILFAAMRIDNSDIPSKVILYFWVSVSAFNLLLVCIPAILLYEEGLKPREALFKLYNREASHISTQDIQRFHMFADQLAQSQVNISGGGFFIVTRSMILTIVSVIITYFLIILQFAMEESCKCDAVQNITAYALEQGES